MGGDGSQPAQELRGQQHGEKNPPPINQLEGKAASRKDQVKKQDADSRLHTFPTSKHPKPSPPSLLGGHHWHAPSQSTGTGGEEALGEELLRALPAQSGLNAGVGSNMERTAAETTREMNHPLGRAGVGINAAPEEGNDREEALADGGEEFGLGQADKIRRQKVGEKKSCCEVQIL